MLERKKTGDEQLRRQKALESCAGRVKQALTIGDVGEKYAALRKIDREIENSFVRTRKVARHAWLLKYGFVLAAAPAIALMTAMLFPVIGHFAFAISVAAAWVGGARAIIKAEKPASEIPYQIYKNKKEAESRPFRDLQKVIAGHANDAVKNASVAELAASPRRRLLARNFPLVRKLIAEHFNAQAKKPEKTEVAALTATTGQPSPVKPG